MPSWAAPGGPRWPQAGPGAVLAASPLKDVFFDFDRDRIREDQQAALNEDAGWLKANSKARLTIKGHCGEQGTAEYSLGLGERRAKAVKNSLVKTGNAADRIITISFGKEHPSSSGMARAPGSGTAGGTS